MTVLEGLKEDELVHPQANYTISTSGMWYSYTGAGCLLIMVNRLCTDVPSSGDEPQKYVKLDEQRQLGYVVK